MRTITRARTGEGVLSGGAAARRVDWQAYFGQDAMPSLLLIAGAVITVRLLIVSNGRPDVAVALITADPAALLLALALEFVALVLPAVAVACLWQFGRALKERAVAAMAQQPPPARYPLGLMLVALFGVLLSLKVAFTSPPFAFLLTAGASIMYVVNDRSERRRPAREALQGAPRRFAPEAPGQRAADRLALRRYWLLGLSLTAVSVVMFNPSMWMAPERIHFRDERVRTGYVIASDPTWTMVMLEDGRRVLPFRTREVTGRQVCAPAIWPMYHPYYRGPLAPSGGRQIPLPACQPSPR